MFDGTKSKAPSFISKLLRLTEFLVGVLGEILNETQLDYWLSHKKELKNKLREAFYDKVQKELPICISITERPDLKTSQLLALCKEKFPVSSYYNDERLDKDFPAPQEVTIRNFLNQQGPDKETLGLSVRQSEEKGFKNGITLRERILLELAYFEATSKHLDIKGVTICSGSRDSDGHVPRAHWLGDEFRLNWYDLDGSYSDSGIRSAVV